MALSRRILFRALDAFLLLIAFLIQSIILSQYLVHPKSSSDEIPCVNPIYQKLLWLVGDLICVTGLLIASLFGVSRLRKKKSNKVETQTSNHDVEPERFFFLSYISSDRVPLSYISWFLYSTFLFIKITVIFTSTNIHMDLQEKASESQDIEPATSEHQYLQLAIGLASIVFTMLVEAHHDSSTKDPKRNAYLNSISFEVALEVLDTAALLSYLIPSFEHIKHHLRLEEVCPAANFSPIILMLSAFNLVLPTILLYKLSATKFGECYHVKLEMIYKTLHLILVNVPFFIVRMYLWNSSDREEVIFSLKNIYGIVSFFRGIHADYRILQMEKSQNSSEKHRNRRQSEEYGKSIRATSSKVSRNGNGRSQDLQEENVVEMKSLMRSGQDEEAQK